MSNSSKHQVGSCLPATSWAGLSQLQPGKTGKHKKTILEAVPGLCRGTLGPSITAGDKNCGLQTLARLAWAQGPADHSPAAPHASWSHHLLLWKEEVPKAPSTDWHACPELSPGTWAGLGLVVRRPKKKPMGLCSEQGSAPTLYPTLGHQTGLSVQKPNPNRALWALAGSM